LLTIWNYHFRVQKSGDRLRVSAQLIDALKGYHLWANRYDRDLKDLFVIQDDITGEIAIALQVELTTGEQARVWHKTDNIDANHPEVHMLFGNLYLTQKKFDQALVEGEKAIALGPNNAEDHYLFSRILLRTGRPKEAIVMAEKANEKQSTGKYAFHDFLPFQFRIWLKIGVISIGNIQPFQVPISQLF
jgi:tetratricopeptide (TPR) repeat protein